MAASSPAPSNSKSGDSPMTAATPNGSATPQRSISLDAPKPTLRGINKPKCIQCGNVARSRCPFQCCKSCCSKAQNPCHIHVLKQNGTLPDKPPPTGTTLSEQPSADVPSTGASWRLSSLRRLSATFANSLRARKPLSRKDAINMNKWRFTKLREHIEGNLQAENEAFERYMQNVSLLEETFSVLERPKPDDPTTSDTTSKDKIQKLVSEIKVKLKSNAEQADNFRQRLRELIDGKLRKLQEQELVNDAGSPSADELDAQTDPKRVKAGKCLADRTAAVNDLVAKLSKARNEDDLVSCLEMKHQLFNQIEGKSIDIFHVQNAGNLLVAKHDSSTMPASSHYSLPKMFTAVHTNQERFSNINEKFSSLDEIAEL